MRDVAAVIADVLAEAAPPARIVIHEPGERTGTEAAAAITSYFQRPVRWTTVAPDVYLHGVATGLGAQYAANIGALYSTGARVFPHRKHRDQTPGTWSAPRRERCGADPTVDITDRLRSIRWDGAKLSHMDERARTWCWSQRERRAAIGA
jgi:hypothetical protein